MSILILKQLQQSNFKWLRKNNLNLKFKSDNFVCKISPVFTLDREDHLHSPCVTPPFPPLIHLFASFLMYDHLLGQHWILQALSSITPAQSKSRQSKPIIWNGGKGAVVQLLPICGGLCWYLQMYSLDPSLAQASTMSAHSRSVDIIIPGDIPSYI